MRNDPLVRGLLVRVAWAAALLGTISPPAGAQQAVDLDARERAREPLANERAAFQFFGRGHCRLPPVVAHPGVWGRAGEARQPCSDLLAHQEVGQCRRLVDRALTGHLEPVKQVEAERGVAGVGPHRVRSDGVGVFDAGGEQT